MVGRREAEWAGWQARSARLGSSGVWPAGGHVLLGAGCILAHCSDGELLPCKCVWRTRWRGGAREEEGEKQLLQQPPPPASSTHRRPRVESYAGSPEGEGTTEAPPTGERACQRLASISGKTNCHCPAELDAVNLRDYVRI